MKIKYKQWLLKSLSLFLATILLSTYMPITSMALEDADPIVVVSLGDSYSSGEGITPFYGQDLPLEEKVWNEDWLAHRSKASWPSRLYIPGMPDGKTLGDYRNATGAYQWYFGAVSGAETKHFKKEQQPKPFCVKAPGFWSGFWVPADEDVPHMPLQLSIFDRVSDDVDYVTLSVGGNDVDFSGIVKQTVHPGAIYTPLKAKFKTLWENINTHEENIKQVYRDINDKTHGTADIIVAGYPELFNKDGKGLVIAKKEATIINENVIKFNTEVLSKIIGELQQENVKIHFVDVAPTFAAGGGHQAYSSDAWINKIDFTPNDQDLDQKAIGSAYSVHPNSRGAQAYADCVNAKIAEIELTKRVGTLEGKICKASDRTTPVTSAEINAYSPLRSEDATPDSNGNYSMELPANRYYVTVKADGYIPFKAYAVVKENQTEYMQTFLMVEGEETDVGSAQGMITNALNGAGLGDVTLDVRAGWNNEDEGEILTTVTTDDYGAYLVTLPIGNYTLCASKDGFAPTMINIIVQKTNSGNQDGTMTPVLSGDNYRIVLRWGENPRDLDSHVVGSLSNGNSFHVYYSHKSQYDGETEVCNLDYDDTTSFGPETITLNATTNKPYYYYIYRYAGSGTVASSGAYIKVYQGENEIATFNVPTNLGSGDYWNVFAIVDGELVVRNTMTNSAETSYANSNISTFSLRAPRTEEHPVYDDTYPAKKGTSVEMTEPTETIPDETEATDQGETTETMESDTTTDKTTAATDATETVDELDTTALETESRKIYLSLDQVDQDYIWTVEVPGEEVEFDVVEETEEIYSVELPEDIDTIILHGKGEDDTEVFSVEISLEEIQEKNCIVAFAPEQEENFEIVWGTYDPEMEEVTLDIQEPLALTDETIVEEENNNPVETTEAMETSEETVTTEETEATTATETSETGNAVS